MLLCLLSRKLQSKFDYNNLPITDYKREIIRDSIKPEYNYIIDEFFLKRRDIKYSLHDLYYNIDDNNNDDDDDMNFDDKGYLNYHHKNMMVNRLKNNYFSLI